VEPSQHHEFNTIKDSVEDWDAFPCIAHVGNIADTETLPPPPPPPWMDTNPAACAPLSDYIAEAWGCDAEGCLETNVQNDPYYPFATCDV